MKYSKKRADAQYKEELAKEMGFKNVEEAIRAGYEDIFMEDVETLKKAKNQYLSYHDYLTKEYPAGYMQGRGASY